MPDFDAGTDTGRGANWAVGRRPLSRRRGVYIIDESDGCEHPGTRREPTMMLKAKVAVSYGGGR
jgi:hypothetical protein